MRQNTPTDSRREERARGWSEPREASLFGRQMQTSQRLMITEPADIRDFETEQTEALHAAAGLTILERDTDALITIGDKLAYWTENFCECDEYLMFLSVCAGLMLTRDG